MKRKLDLCNTIELSQGQAIVLRAGEATEIVGVRGTLWITSTQNRDDTIVTSGESVKLPERGTTYVTSFGAATAHLVKPRRQPSWHDALAARWAGLWGRRHAGRRHSIEPI